MNASDLLKQSVSALQRGDVAAALASSEAVLRAHPRLAVAHLVRGRALLERGDWEEAVTALRASVELEPCSAEAHLTLGAALCAGGRVRDAWTHHERALELAPGTATVVQRVAGFACDQGELDTALALYEQASRLGSPEALGGRIAILERRGELPEAGGLLERHPDALRSSPRLRITAARLLRRLGRADEAIELLRSAGLERLTPALRASVLFALGDALDERGEHRRAFDCWRQANELRGQCFDARAHVARVDAILASNTCADFARLPRAKNADDRPVFLVGAPRSGSTLVEEILATQAAVHAAGELDDVPALARSLERGSEAALDAAARRYLARFDGLDPRPRRITDKLPHNAFFLGEIAQMFPAARVVYVTRDPLDAGLSIFARDFHATHDYATDLGAIGVFLREHRRLLEHWREHLPLALHELSYERLVAHPEDTTRGLLDFLGLPWDPSALRFHESERVARTASYAQVRRPLYRSSVGRWRAHAEWLAPLRTLVAGGA
jgi:tetratricopeptide (TPR) repeat protein